MGLKVLFQKIYIMVTLFSVILFITIWNHIGMISLSTQVDVPVKRKLCNVSYEDRRSHLMETDLLMIYYVTPTYPRAEQMPELTRLAHTLMHVPRIHWIVADDQPLCSEPVLNILRRTGLPFTHYSSPKPNNVAAKKARGVSNRQAALAWIRENVDEGILYFGDDDNTVDLELFDEIRKTKKVSMFPVGLVGEFRVSSPIVSDGKVIGFFDSWPAKRTFPVDMAGFAVNIKFLKPTAVMPYIIGHEEDRFLLSLGLTIEDIEPLADNCSKILVWHTKTVKNKRATIKIQTDAYEKLPQYQSFAKLLKETQKLGMTKLDDVIGKKPFVTHDRKSFDLVVK